MFQRITLFFLVLFSFFLPTQMLGSSKSSEEIQMVHEPSENQNCMNIVMATDANYVVPTAVAMRSIVQHCQGPLFFVLFVTHDVKENEGFSVLLQSFADEGKRIKVCLIDIDGIKSSKQLRIDFKKAQEKIPKKLIALRILFPKIWEGQDLPEFDEEENKDLYDIKEFLWLDSDIIVNQDLRNFYAKLSQLSNEDPLTQDLGQAIISANHRFIKMSPDVSYKDGIEYRYEFIRENNDQLGSLDDNTKGVSGGVVFWNLIAWEKSEDRVRNDLSFTSRNSFIQNVLRCTHIKTEEDFLNFMLNNTRPKAYFFPTTYNCRSAYLKEARRFLDDTELSMTEEARNVLLAIVSRNVAIWHWDYEKKPWTYSSSGQMGSPERLWWSNFYDLVGMFPKFNHMFMSIKARPVFSDFKAEQEIELRSLDQIPPVTDDIPNGTTCTLPGKQTVRLYRNPQNPNMWLVRVPVGGRGNRCAIHALGITENGEAQEIIRGYNGRWIDVHDANFWNQMAGILGGPIEIYTALDFGRPDNRNGTLRQVARYGNGSRAVTRVYARNGHYNALLSEMDPYHIGRFIENVARTKGQDDDPPEAMTQGPALF